MKLKKISYLLATISMLILVIPVFAANGPKTAKMTIHVYDAPTPENWDLESGILDINDWPLSKEFIDRWVANPDIAMGAYSEMGKMEVDINNQRWPCGHGEHQEYDSASGTWKTYYDDSCQWCTKSRVFRIALAYLLDKDSIVRDILKGYAYRMDTFVPMIALIGYTDYPAFETTVTDLTYITGEGLIYHYNPTTAAALLDLAGFPEGTTPNPNYDAAFPNSSQYIRTDPKNGGADLGQLDYYIRMDDPNRMSAGILHAAAMNKMGIPTKAIVTERTVCYQRVMVEYDYDLYTGGWSLGADPTWTWTLMGSEFYYAPIGWATNYAGFCNREYDTAAYACYTATDMGTVKAKCLEAQAIYANMSCILDLWASAAVKAYQSKWDGLVNNFGYGLDNYFTFLNMYDTSGSPSDTINWGFKSDIEAIHPVSSEWMWDWNVIGLIYETGYGREPFDLSVRYPWLFTSWDTTTYTHATEGTCTNTTYYIRSGVTWHDGTTFDAVDVKFTLDFKEACGVGVAWEYPDLKYIENVTIKDPLTVEVKYNYQSVYAPDIAGFTTYIQRDLWMAANTTYNWNYDEVTATFTPTDNRFLVRDYHVWEHDANTNAIIDIKEDGTGAWVFDEYQTGEHVKLTAYASYYKTQATIQNDIASMFHWGVGDINENSGVDIPDLFLITKAWLTSSGTGGTPGDWGAWNPACDIVTDDYIDVYDLTKATINYGKIVG